MSGVRTYGVRGRRTCGTLSVRTNGMLDVRDESDVEEQPTKTRSKGLAMSEGDDKKAYL